MSHISAIILAAGKGTRMKSDLPKVLHTLNDQPMIQYVIDSVKNSDINDIHLIVGHKSEMVMDTLDNDVSYILQNEQLGTGHAVMMARDSFKDKNGLVLVLCGDTPLITSKTLMDFILFHEKEQASCTVLTTLFDNPTGYGRIIRDNNQLVSKIVEEKDASDDIKIIQEEKE